jgi:hypothetical protein
MGAVLLALLRLIHELSHTAPRLANRESLANSEIV